MTTDYRLLEVKRITGKLVVITGLRVGAGQETMEIGGMDNPIIRNPATGEPYIPGSSIKGKMRSLLEWYLGRINGEGKVWSAKDAKEKRGESPLECPILRIFGVSASENLQVGPTRLIVRDAFLTDEFRKKFHQGKPIVEVKSENTINRLTAKAMPRPMERVVPGTEFDFELVYRVIKVKEDETDDEKIFDDYLKLALKLLELNYLGSAGSRGCGQIKFKDLKDEADNDISLPEKIEFPEDKKSE